MRRQPTEPERRIWMLLRSSRFHGYKFRRQAVIGSRIVDFFCPASGPAIEIDGNTHDRKSDLRRDLLFMRAFGFDTLRFSNLEVMTNIDGVQAVLLQTLQAQASRWKRGRGAVAETSSHPRIRQSP